MAGRHNFPSRIRHRRSGALERLLQTSERYKNRLGELRKIVESNSEPNRLDLNTRQITDLQERIARNNAEAKILSAKLAKMTA